MTDQSQDRRVIHITDSLSRSGGGIPAVVWSLAQYTRKLGYEVVVSGLKDEHFEADCRAKPMRIIAGTVRGPWSLGYSPELKQALTAQICPTDVVHTHGLWKYPGTLASRLSHRSGCKRVVSPHGMLEPWALRHSGWKKRIANWLYEKKNLETADCLHALCDAEAESFRKYGLKNPIAVIPNGVESPAAESPANKRDKQDLINDHPHLKERNLLLFLSRLHPKKGLADLLHAWRKVGAQDRNWSLLLAGPDELNHEATLRNIASQLGIDRHVHFLGAAYGRQKVQLLTGADAFVLPSYSEGFSMAVLEAASMGLSALLTRECNFPELAAAQAAIEVPAGLAGISEGLDSLLSLNERQRLEMGSRGKDLVNRTYVWPAVASQMVKVYDWLTRTGPKPAFVRDW